jgi:hypothetical protein
LLVCLVFLVWRRQPAFIAMTALAAVGTVRYVVAYRRARARAV